MCDEFGDVFGWVFVILMMVGFVVFIWVVVGLVLILFFEWVI